MQVPAAAKCEWSHRGLSEAGRSCRFEGPRLAKVTSATLAFDGGLKRAVSHMWPIGEHPWRCSSCPSWSRFPKVTSRSVLRTASLHLFEACPIFRAGLVFLLDGTNTRRLDLWILDVWSRRYTRDCKTRGHRCRVAVTVLSQPLVFAHAVPRQSMRVV
ncbi:hypothetical protein BC567DRAFT_232125 [Phyllosticta citribraziliensis]